MAYGTAEDFTKWASEPTRVDVAILATMKKLAYVEGRGDDMRRDMELVREILKLVHEKPHLQHMTLNKVEGYDDLAVARHVEMLFKAGYIEGLANSGGFGKASIIRIYDLSWQGHEFYGAIATDEGTWQKVKAAFGPEKLATAPLKMIENVATQALTAWAMGKMGL